MKNDYKIIGAVMLIIGFGLLIQVHGLATAGIIALILWGNNIERYKQ
jgi:hypothetical protein